MTYENQLSAFATTSWEFNYKLVSVTYARPYDASSRSVPLAGQAFKLFIPQCFRWSCYPHLYRTCISSRLLTLAHIHSALALFSYECFSQSKLWALLLY